MTWNFSRNSCPSLPTVWAWLWRSGLGRKHRSHSQYNSPLDPGGGPGLSPSGFAFTDYIYMMHSILDQHAGFNNWDRRQESRIPPLGLPKNCWVSCFMTQNSRPGNKNNSSSSHPPPCMLTKLFQNVQSLIVSKGFFHNQDVCQSSKQPYEFGKAGFCLYLMWSREVVCSETLSHLAGEAEPEHTSCLCPLFTVSSNSSLNTDVVFLL
jgi:hypothetical protein